MDDELMICELFQWIEHGWNTRDGDALAAAFTENARMVGFDGTEVKGRAAIATLHNNLFQQHGRAHDDKMGLWLGKIRDVQILAGNVAVLSAVGSFLLPDKHDPERERNSIYSATAVKENGDWRLALFQSTPAQFHGRPEEGERLTSELRDIARQRTS